MKKKKLIIIIISLLLICALSVFLIVNNHHSKSDYSDIESQEEISDEYDEGVSYDEEIEGSDFEKVKKNADSFIGTWIGNSSKTEYYYGNLEISILDDGTWSGTITDEPFNGTWQESEDGLLLHCELVDFDLTFSDQGNLVLQEFNSQEAEDEPIAIVLERK